MDKDLVASIAEHAGAFTKLERRIAAYLTANPEAILVDTSASIAERCFVSPMTVTRFFRKLGFEDAASAKRHAGLRFTRSTPSGIDGRFERFQRFRPRVDEEAQTKTAIAAVRTAFELRSRATWRGLINAVAHADSVFAVGFQTMSYLATGLVLRLSYVRPNVHELDGVDGVYAKLFADTAPKQTLILIDSFRYARNGPVLARLARDRGAEVVIFCDESCDWAADITPFVFSLPSESGFFFRPGTALHLSLHLLIQDVIDELGEPVRQQLELLSDAQERFGQFLA